MKYISDPFGCRSTLIHADNNLAPFNHSMHVPDVLVRSHTAPSISCLDVHNVTLEEDMKRLKQSTIDGDRKTGNGTLHRAPKISNRKKRKILHQLGHVANGIVQLDELKSAAVSGLLEIDEEDKELNIHDKDYVEKDITPLQIAMLIVGTRGDVQPFVAIGKRLQEHGHRVRLATHENFQDFVLKAGLDFFPLGGDPKVLAGYMVKNKGILPSGPSEIKVTRDQIKAIINSLYPACTEPDMRTSEPFTAQAIISNPPAYGHVHVAEALNVPIHIFFTMPWTPTSQFPHPLSRIKTSAGYRLSYQVVDSIIWWGTRGLINDFRKKKLELQPISYFSRVHGSISHLPTCYMWSPHLVPKPNDWGPRVDVVGYCFLDLAKDYKPPEPLVKWLEAGETPIYIGFGSLPVPDSEVVFDTILKSLQETNHRVIIDRGWSGFGNVPDHPKNVYLIENCPHDWLFLQCAAVVHHGGAGTTAAGLKAACPTTVVPFFGDQLFWGESIHGWGLGPAPFPINEFSQEKLVAAINYMLHPDVKSRALEIAKLINEEDGVGNAVRAFQKHLPRAMPQLPRPPSPSIFDLLFGYVRVSLMVVMDMLKGHLSYLSGLWSNIIAVISLDGEDGRIMQSHS